MSKQVDAKNQIWYVEEGKFIRMGLTRSFLETLDECWHILPSNMKAIKQKAPLLTIESNDGLISLLSPVTGNLSNWDSKAANFPEKLTEEDVIVTLTSEEVVQQQSPSDAERAAARGRLEAQGIIGNGRPETVGPPFVADLETQRAFERLRTRQAQMAQQFGIQVTDNPWTGAPASEGVTGRNPPPQRRVNAVPMPEPWFIFDDETPAQP